MNVFEEIHAIWTQQLLNNDKEDLHEEIRCNVNQHRIFMPKTIEWTIQKYWHWMIQAQFDPINREVYQIDVCSLGNGTARYRWVNPKYIKQYYKNNFDYQMDDVHVKEVYTDYSPDKILEIARDTVEGITYNNDGTVNIPLDLSDEEFLDIAKAAHELDITINEFMTQTIESHIKQINDEY